MFYSDFVEEVIKTWRRNKTEQSSWHTYICYALSETASGLRLALAETGICNYNNMQELQEYTMRMGRAIQAALEPRKGYRCMTFLEYLAKIGAEQLISPDEVREAFLSCLYAKALAEDNGD